MILPQVPPPLDLVTQLFQNSIITVPFHQPTIDMTQCILYGYGYGCATTATTITTTITTVLQQLLNLQEVITEGNGRLDVFDPFDSCSTRIQRIMIMKITNSGSCGVTENVEGYGSE